MTRYKVSFEIEVNEGHPRKWIPETVAQGLEAGEDIDNWTFEEMPDQPEQPSPESSPKTLPDAKGAMRCPCCGAQVETHASADELFPKEFRPDWHADGDCDTCNAELRYEFSPTGARQVSHVGWSK